MRVYFLLCVWGAIACARSQPTTQEVPDVKFKATATTENKIGSEETSTVSVTDTTSTTESTRSPKSETKKDGPLLLSQGLQTEMPKRKCGRRYARNARIIGGSDTYEGEYPWAISLRLLTTHYCGGAIINRYWILTAAHCVKRYTARYFRVRAGDYDIAKDGYKRDIDIQVEEISIHPMFGKPRRYSNDVALIRLKKPLTYSNIAQPICLPDPDLDLEGRNATVVGWGWSDEVEKKKSKILQKVQVPLLNNTICAKWYGEVYNGYVQIYDYQLCGGYKEGGKDACQGDSGGPLIMKDGDHFTIVGVVSAGVGCGRKDLPGIYSRVSIFVPWIEAVTGTGL